VRLRELQVFFLLFALNASFYGNQKEAVTDALGFAYVVESAPQRIISLAPNITEILFSLGLGEKVVGVTSFCDYPPQAQEKEKIGGWVDPNLERIKALNPDLIIGFRGNPLRILKRIRSLGLPLFVLEIGDDLEFVFSVIEKIGKVTLREKEAESLIQSLRNKYDAVQSALKDVEHQPKVFLSIHGFSFWTSGKESFLNDLLIKARGENIAGNIPQQWLLYKQEQLIHQNPEIIIILCKSLQEFLKAKEWIKTKTHLQEVSAVKTDRVYFLDENLAARPGPRLFEALEELARILHPKNFEDKR
jgi:iron complex transport system substrate-binding protein